MNRKNRLPFLLLLPLLFIPQRGLALQFCDAALDEAECERTVRATLLKDVPVAQQLEGAAAQKAIQDLMLDKDGVGDTAARDLLTKVAPEIAALPGASAALEDFLNRLRIGVTSEGTDDMPALAFDFTNFLGLPTKNGYKLQAVAREPVLYEALSSKLSEEDRDKRTKGLGSFDDVLVSLAYSPSTPRWGNNLGAHQILIDELLREFLAQNEALAVAATEAKEARDDLSEELPGEALSEETGLVVFARIPDEARRREFRAAVERAAIADANKLSSVSRILNSGEFFEIADLVANQPQLVGKATAIVRDELTGPEEMTLKISYEMGFVNMNSLRKALAACAATQKTTCFTTYVRDHRADAAVANRLKFSVDWTRQQDYHPTVDGVSLDLPGKERWTFTTAYGRNLRVDVDGEFTSRFDFTGSWEDWSDDPLHQDRGLANLSFTQKVTDDMSLVLGAVWASKPEFRGEVDKEVSARFGLTYRFLDQKGKDIMRKPSPPATAATAAEE